MARIEVIVRKDLGELGVHPRLGPLVPGAKLLIEEEQFGAELFERPTPDYLSPHEKADAARAAELEFKVGHQDPPAKTSNTSDTSDKSDKSDKAKKEKEVTRA